MRSKPLKEKIELFQGKGLSLWCLKQGHMSKAAGRICADRCVHWCITLFYMTKWDNAGDQKGMMKAASNQSPVLCLVLEVELVDLNWWIACKKIKAFVHYANTFLYKTMNHKQYQDSEKTGELLNFSSYLTLKQYSRLKYSIWGPM